jgi:hypothetical protein
MRKRYSRVNDIDGPGRPSCRTSRYGTKDRIPDRLEVICPRLQHAPIPLESLRSGQAGGFRLRPIAHDFMTQARPSAIERTLEGDQDRAFARGQDSGQVAKSLAELVLKTCPCGYDNVLIYAIACHEYGISMTTRIVTHKGCSSLPLAASSKASPSAARHCSNPEPAIDRARRYYILPSRK